MMKKFLDLIEQNVKDGECWVFDLINHAYEIGVPDHEIPEAVYAWAWADDPTDTNFDAVEGTPDEAAWRWAHEGGGGKWNNPRYLRDRFPHAYRKKEVVE